MVRRMLALIHTILLKIRYGSHLKAQRLLHFQKGCECNILDGKMVVNGSLTAFKHCAFSVVGGHLEIGDGCFFNRNCIVVSKNSIKIGTNCSFGPGVCLYDHDHKFDKNGIVGGKYSLGSIVIGDNCWIGAGAIILRNTHIGDGCVIGAGAVVKGNIPAHSLVTAGRDLQICPIIDKENK